MNRKEALAQWQSTPQWKQMEEQFYRDKRDVAAIFAASVRVEIYRFKTYSGLDLDKPVIGELQSIPYCEVGAEQGRRFALRLAGLILNPRNYFDPSGSMWMCDFQPTVGFRVWSADDFVDVIVCFSCGELIYLHSGSGFRGNSHHKDDISLISGQLRALVEEAFAP